LDFRVVNAGVSGDTSAGGRRRIEWLLRQPLAVLVVALGGNDMLRGLDLRALRENLGSIIDAARTAHPDLDVVVAGMRAPRNLGRAYADGFDATFPAVAAEHDAGLVPFLLEGVAAEPSLNQADGIHPTVRGHEMIADTVWSTLENVLRARRSNAPETPQ
jgi:acyl-CoA thioesterase-1